MISIKRIRNLHTKEPLIDNRYFMEKHESWHARLSNYNESNMLIGDGERAVKLHSTSTEV